MSADSNIQVLVSPLDWGLGHATRCIPIIKTLNSLGATVIIASGGPQLTLLRAEFPGTECIEIPGYGIRYSAKKGGLVRRLIFRIPAILLRIRRENAWLKNFCRQRRIDAIISDNRYGFYHKKIWSVFITHQLFIQTGMGERVNRLLLRLHYFFIERFSECWVPDGEEPFSLARLLSHPPWAPAIPVRCTGILSRFQRSAAVISNPLLILISGPESARTDFENKVLEELGNYQGAAVMVRGLPDGKEEKIIQDKRIVIFNHLVSGQLSELINRSAIVISRSGYSTIMDLARLGKKAVLVPTPGQPEQEYLARELDKKKWALLVSQDAFNLDACLKEISQSAIGFPEFPEEDLLGKLVGEFLTRIRKNHLLEYRKK